MERLTKTFEENGKLFACLPECEHRCVYGWNEYNAGCRCSKFTKILKRLAIIEDILGDNYDLDRLRELVEADRDGRCVVLPCKDWLEIVFGEQETFYGIDHDYEENPVREITVCNEERFTWYDGWETVVLKGSDKNGLDWEFSPEDIGKTVFLTREAAEAALKGKQHENQT